jgi:cytochrome c5
VRLSRIRTAVCLLAGASAAACGPQRSTHSPQSLSDASTPVAQSHTNPGGKAVFRFDTFGSEQFWTDTLRLATVIEKDIDPTTAMSFGLKVDAEALPSGMLDKADLRSPLTTVALLKLNALVGLKATVDENNHITTVGVTCALCHSTVDNSVAPGVGRRLDGWPNRDLDVGAIIALSPVLPADKKAVYQSWGRGKYDPRYHIDGQNSPVLLPPAYGLKGVENETYTAEGPRSYCANFVAVTQSPRGDQSPDSPKDKLLALKKYQSSLQAPLAPAGSFDAVAAARGRGIFERNCSTCHVHVIGTDNNIDGFTHHPGETAMDPTFAERTANKRYRSTPLRGLWQHPPYFHDGSASTLADVVNHYDKVRNLGLDTKKQRDLVEFLKSGPAEKRSL